MTKTWNELPETIKNDTFAEAVAALRACNDILPLPEEGRYRLRSMLRCSRNREEKARLAAMNAGNAPAEIAAWQEWMGISRWLDEVLDANDKLTFGR